jgi:hypothetical protein
VYSILAVQVEIKQSRFNHATIDERHSYKQIFVGTTAVIQNTKICSVLMRNYHINIFHFLIGDRIRLKCGVIFID